MDDGDAIRGRSSEAEWAQRWAREAVAKLRARMDEEEACRRLTERTGIRSTELVARMRALGFDADSVSLLFLVPVVGIARADGTVSYTERSVVKQLARRGGIPAGSTASAMLDGWLMDPPAGEELDRLLALWRDVLAVLPPDQADELADRTRAALERVGRASGGVLGIGAMSRAERTFLAQVMGIV